MTIRNDATRTRIATKEKRRPRAVVARQGQVLLDADFDQQARHQIDRVEIETRDTLGSPNKALVPAGNTGFNVVADGTPANFNIGAGHAYLNGWLVENPDVCKLSTQPHRRTGDTVNAPALIALKALIRHLDPVEEPNLADKALGDAQASGRSLVDWQVFPVAVNGATDCTTAVSNSAWGNLIAPSTGKLKVIEATGGSSTDPCSLTPSGGYSRLENLLYRFEVHSGVTLANADHADGPRFGLHDLKIKFSRRNASVMARITGINGKEISVNPPALDPRNWFAPGLYAEIVSLHDDVDPRAALSPSNERLFRVALAGDDRIILEETASKTIAATGAQTNGEWFLRLWDAFPNGEGVAVVSAPNNASESAEIDIGDGLKIKLEKGATGIFRRGDYWTCAARADGSTDWPKSANQPEAMQPHGPDIRYAPIAFFKGQGASPNFEDCRIPFATLSDRTLLYRGGDGQTAFAATDTGMVDLPAKLRVGVMRGETPVKNATVRWSFVGPAGGSCAIKASTGASSSSLDTFTGADGLTEVTWAIDAAKPLDLHQLKAELVSHTGSVIQPPVIFSARFATAAHTSYAPGKCEHLAEVNNVQEALDLLCSKIGQPKPDALTLKSILLLGRDKKTAELVHDNLILNALEVPHGSFGGGIAFGFDSSVDIHIEAYDPVVEIEIEVPFPLGGVAQASAIKYSADENKNSTVMLTQTSNKTEAIQAIREIMGLGLKEAKSLIDGGLPTAIKQNMGRAEAEVLVSRLKAMGATAEITETTKPSAARGFIGFQRVRLDGTVEVAKGPKSGPGLVWKPSDPAARFLEEAAWPDLMNRLLCRIRLRSALIWAKGEGDKRIYLNAEYLGVSAKATQRELLVSDRDPQRAGDLDMFIYLVR